MVVNASVYRDVQLLLVLDFRIFHHCPLSFPHSSDSHFLLHTPLILDNDGAFPVSTKLSYSEFYFSAITGVCFVRLAW